MHEKTDDSAAISWELFNDLYENQHDLLRKLRFIIKAGKVSKSEPVALEMIEDYLNRKEVELKNIREAGLEEWSRRGKPTRSLTTTLKMPKDVGNFEQDKALTALIPANRISIWGRILSMVRGK